MSTDLEGWGPAIQQMVPWKRIDKAPIIRPTRVLWIAFVVALLLTLWVASTILTTDGGYPTRWLAIWATFSAAAGVAAWVIRRKRLTDLSRINDRSLFLGGYRTTFFVTIALTESVALAGFAISFVVDSLIPYLVAAPVGVALMTMAAPTTRSLSRLQEMIDERGGTLRVAEVFMSTDWS